MDKKETQTDSKPPLMLKRSTNKIDFSSQPQQESTVKPALTKSNTFDMYKPKIPTFFTEDNEIRKNCRLFPCEDLKAKEKTYYKTYHSNWVGVFVITDYRMVFCFEKEKKLDELKMHPDFFNIPFFQIEKVMIVQDKEKTGSCTFEVTLKDTRVLKFFIWEKESKLISLLNEYCFPTDPEKYFGFTSTYSEYIVNKAGQEDKESSLKNGWELYDPVREFQRQGVLESNELNLRYCYANKDFKLFPTYPEFLVVHGDMAGDQLIEASKHRTKNRLPALSFFYGKDKKGNKTKAAIWRSSQTKSGLTGAKNDMDVALLNKIAGLCGKLIIFDARPYINAVANKAGGGGFENVDHYEKAEIVFCDIDNIHAVRNSLTKVQQLCLAPKIKLNQKFWSLLEETKWYLFIHLLLKYSYQIARTIRKNCSVLIHCSDGWDRTSQLVSISQLLLDPYYRTIVGFGVLIEKDWLSFGHQFGIRNGIYFKKPKEDQRSPIFLQFLDCIHQLLLQFPNAFEFNDSLLVFLANNYNSNLYGTFMYNSECERREKSAKTTATSVWTDVIANIAQYKNAFYQSSSIVERLKPDYSPSSITPWFEFFMQYNSTIKHLSVYSSETGVKRTFRAHNEFYSYIMEKEEVKYQKLEEKCKSMRNFILTVQQETKDNELFKQLSLDAQMLLEEKKEEPQINPKNQNKADEESSSSEEENTKKIEEENEDLEAL